MNPLLEKVLVGTVISTWRTIGSAGSGQVVNVISCVTVEAGKPASLCR